MARDIVQRIILEGSEEIKAKLRELGKEGEDAAKKVDDLAKSFDAPSTNTARGLANLRNELTQTGQATGILRDGLANIGITGAAATTVIDGVAGVFAALQGAALVAGVAIGGVVAAALLAGPAFIRLGQAAGEAVAKLVKTAQDVGTTAQKLQEFSRGAQAAGVDAGKLAGGLREIDRAFGKALLEADKNAEKVTTGFKRISLAAEDTLVGVERLANGTRTTYGNLNVTVTRFGDTQKNAAKETDGLAAKIQALIGPVKAGTDSIEIFNRLVAKIGQMPDTARRRSLIDDLGIDGLAEAVAAGSKKVNDSVEEMKGSFRTLTPEIAKAGTDGEDAANKLSAAWAAFKQDFGISFTPLSTAVQNFVTTTLESMGRINKAQAEGGVGEGLLASFKLYGSQISTVFVDPTLRAFDLIKGAANLVVPNIGEGLSKLGTVLSDTFSQAVARLPEVFSAANFAQIWTDISTAATTTWDAVSSAASTAASAVAETFAADKFAQIWADIESGATSAWASVSAAGEAAGASLSELGGRIGRDFSRGVLLAVDGIRDGFASLVASLQSLWEGFVNFVTSAVATISNVVSSVVNSVLAAVRSVAGAIASIGSGGGGGGGGGGEEGFASGGYVRGPGGPRSDSILARLSNGEFVIQARAVDRYGLSLLNAINGLRLPRSALAGFAAGGLVSVPALAGGLPAFANGGLVDAFASTPISRSVAEGGGSPEALAPVTLNIGGQTVEGLLAPQSAIDELERFATRQALLSTGRAAGWKGGRN